MGESQTTEATSAEVKLWGKGWEGEREREKRRHTGLIHWPGNTDAQRGWLQRGNAGWQRYVLCERERTSGVQGASGKQASHKRWHTQTQREGRTVGPFVRQGLKWLKHKHDAEQETDAVRRHGGTPSYPPGACFHVACPTCGPPPPARCPGRPSPSWVCRGTACGTALDKALGRGRPGRGWKGKAGMQELGVVGVQGARRWFLCGSRCWGSTGRAPWPAVGQGRTGTPRARGWGKGACSPRLRRCRCTGARSQRGSSLRFDKSARCTRMSVPLLSLRGEKKKTSWSRHCWNQGACRRGQLWMLEPRLFPPINQRWLFTDVMLLKYKNRIWSISTTNHFV